MIVTIDTTKETTPALYAKKIGVDVHVISNWIKRDKIRYRKIKELNLTLVEIGSESDKIIERRKRIIEAFLNDMDEREEG